MVDETSIGPFGGSTFLSQVVDTYVTIHAAVAILFASVALFLPSVFGFFTLDSTSFAFDSVSSDAVRWSAPFVYGFGFLAASSLYFPSGVRQIVSKIFAVAFLIATASGTYIQQQGRWKGEHILFPILFGTLGLCYGLFGWVLPGGFERVSMKDTKRRS